MLNLVYIRVRLNSSDSLMKTKILVCSVVWRYLVSIQKNYRRFYISQKVLSTWGPTRIPLENKNFSDREINFNN